MAELGQLLQKARLERGMTLEELEDTTKIRKRYLQAIESEQFEVLPGNFYVRAFIKSYAEAVGLDPEKVMQLYKSSIPVPDSEVRAEPARPKHKNRSITNTDRIARWASTLLFLCFLILIVALIYHFVLSNNQNRSDSLVDETRITDRSAAPETGNGGSAPANQPGQGQSGPVEPRQEEESDPLPEVKFITRDGSTVIYSVSNVPSIQLTLEVIGQDCWVQVKQGGSNGTELKQGMYHQGDTESWELAESVYIRLGYPAAARLTVNGIKVEEEHFSGSNPVNFQFNLVTGEQDA